MRLLLLLSLSLLLTHCVSLNGLRGHRDEWETLSTAEGMGAVTYPYCTAVGDRIYAVGGIKETNAKQENVDTYVFDLQTKRWKAVAKIGSMKARANYSGAVLDDKAYIFGGEFPDFSKEAEALDLASGAWHPATGFEALDARGRASLLPAGKRLFVYGGKGLKKDLNAGFVDPARGAFEPVRVPEKLGTRVSFVAAVSGEEIFLWGGFQGAKRSDDGYLYNFETKAWTYVPADNRVTARANAAFALWRNQLYVFGGKADERGRAEVWIWDFKTRAWTPGPSLDAFGVSDLRGAQLIAVPNQGLLLMGGRHEIDHRYESHIYRLKAEAKAWELFDRDAPPPGLLGSCAGVAKGRIIYVIGDLGLQDGEGPGLSEYDQIWLYQWPEN